MVKKDSPLLEHPNLRDYLAAVRTRLSNERTLLSYLRAGLTMIIAGVSAFNVFQSLLMRGLGVAFVASGVVVMIVGNIRYRRLDTALAVLREPDYTTVDHPIVQRSSVSRLAGQVYKKLVQ